MKAIKVLDVIDSENKEENVPSEHASLRLGFYDMAEPAFDINAVVEVSLVGETEKAYIILIEVKDSRDDDFVEFKKIFFPKSHCTISEKEITIPAWLVNKQVELVQGLMGVEDPLRKITYQRETEPNSAYIDEDGCMSVWHSAVGCNRPLYAYPDPKFPGGYIWCHEPTCAEYCSGTRCRVGTSADGDDRYSA